MTSLVYSSDYDLFSLALISRGQARSWEVTGRIIICDIMRQAWPTREGERRERGRLHLQRVKGAGERQQQEAKGGGGERGGRGREGRWKVRCDFLRKSFIFLCVKWKGGVETGKVWGLWLWLLVVSVKLLVDIGLWVASWRTGVDSSSTNNLYVSVHERDCVHLSLNQETDCLAPTSLFLCLFSFPWKPYLKR